MKSGLNNLKFRKHHIVYLNHNKVTQKSFKLNYGTFGIQACESGNLLAKQIEAIRKVIRRTTGKKTKFCINVYPYHPVTKKPVAVRMGKGKGSHSHWVIPVKKGQILYEINLSNYRTGLLAFNKAKKKLPIKTKPQIFLY